MDESKTYVHYGAKHFEREKFKPIKNVTRNVNFTKPREGGLWASPVNAKHSWKDWCEENDYDMCNLEKSFRFRLQDGAKVLHVFTADDLAGLPSNMDPDHEWNMPNWTCLDFEELVRMGYDAVELEDIEEMYYVLYGWDCDSILVMNPNVVEEVEG